MTIDTSKLKRYKPGYVHSNDGPGYISMLARDDGEYVRLEDVKAITSAIEQAMTQQRVECEAVDRDAWAEALELPEGYTVEEFLPGGWHYAWTRADGERMVSGTTWNHPALAAIAAWQYAPTTTPHPSADAVRELQNEVDRLNAIVNTPQSNDFLRAVSTEAEHQRQRWGSDHDRGKTPADWFWLVGYLAGKALHAHAASDLTKAEHHVITAAAALANWHMAMFGNTDMCPGIDGESLLTSPTTGADGDNT